MCADKLELATGFEPKGEQDWTPLAEASLKGRPLAKLTQRTHDGLEIPPLYGPERDLGANYAGLPGQSPFVRGAQLDANAGLGWRIAAEYADRDLAALQSTLMRDLEGGVSQIQLRIAGPGRDGAPLNTAQDFDDLLKDVDETLVPIYNDAGSSYAASAATLAAHWRKQGLDLKKVSGNFGADPLGSLAQQGELPGSLDGAITAMADVAIWAQSNAPAVRTCNVSGAPYHDAGASGVQELAYVLATALEYLRALVESGLSIKQAAGQIEVSVTVGARFFYDIAKLRAARRLWARVQEALGIEHPQVILHAVASGRMLTKKDPWVNMLRSTTASFAGAMGGVQSIRLGTFDSLLQPPSALGRRVNRNTQVILQEESHLGVVMDPTGGSWFIESLTDELGLKAWGEFQKIEAASGMAGYLTSGRVQTEVAESWQLRAKDISKRKIPITGVSEFADPEERPVGTAQAQADVKTPAPAVTTFEGGFEAAIDASVQGANLSTLVHGLMQGAPCKITCLAVHRDAEGFEALRYASDAYRVRTGSWPRIFTVTLGSAAQHTARAMWAKNFFAAAGIETVTAEGATDLAEALNASGTGIALICGPDELYAEQGAATATALKTAGAAGIYMAGKAGPNRSELEAAGVQSFIHLGCNVLEILQGALATLGVQS